MIERHKYLKLYFKKLILCPLQSLAKDTGICILYKILVINDVKETTWLPQMSLPSLLMGNLDVL